MVCVEFEDVISVVVFCSLDLFEEILVAIEPKVVTH